MKPRCYALNQIHVHCKRRKLRTFNTVHPVVYPDNPPRYESKLDSFQYSVQLVQVQIVLTFRFRFSTNIKMNLVNMENEEGELFKYDPYRLFRSSPNVQKSFQNENNMTNQRQHNAHGL